MKTVFKFIGLASLPLFAACVQAPEGSVSGTPRAFQTATYDHWDVRGRFSTRDQIFQNVTQEDLITLLSGKTLVGYEESGGSGLGYGAISVTHHSPDLMSYSCVVSYKTGQPEGDDAYVAPRQMYSVVGEAPNLGVNYPMLKSIQHDGSSGYGIVQYNSQSGQLAILGAYGPKLEDIRKGHLQNGIPAAVYTACPDFPSAESLGTFVNQNQTSWNYFELVQQDPGDRVRRPDLVTAYTPTPIGGGEQ